MTADEARTEHTEALRAWLADDSDDARDRLDHARYYVAKTGEVTS